MKGLILEGIYGSGKSSVMSSLKEKIGDIRSDSCLFFSEVFTQRMKEHLIDQSPRESLLPMKTLVDQITVLSALYAQSRMPNDKRREMFSLSYLFESFHLNAAVRYNLEWEDIAEIDRNLSSEKCKVVFLKIPEDQIKARSIVMTRQTRDPEWSEYLQTHYKMLDDDLADKFMDMQRKMEALLGKTTMPVSILDTGNMNWDQISEKTLAVWQD